MKQDDYRNMCDEIKLSEEQKDKIWVAARAKVQTKKENRQKMGRFAKIAMAAAAIIVFFMVTAMPDIIRNRIQISLQHRWKRVQRKIIHRPCK